MAEENKLYLPYVLEGILTKLSALFFQKLVLYDSQALESKSVRHYDFECEGLITLINFLERKVNKNQVFAFQMLKDPDADLFDD